MKTLLVALSLLLSGTSLHEFHVSKCQIEYVETEQSLQISMHIFIDDLEEALRQRGKDQLFICTKREAKEAEQYLIDYLRNRISIKVNEQKVDFNFVGKEISDGLAAVWCYLEVKGIDQLSQLEISNKLLQEVFEDQKNLMSIIGPNGKKGYALFQKGSKAERFTY